MMAISFSTGTPWASRPRSRYPTRPPKSTSAKPAMHAASEARVALHRAELALGRFRSTEPGLGQVGWLGPRRPEYPGRGPFMAFPRKTRSQAPRSEEHTSELQSPYDLVCR